MSLGTCVDINPVSLTAEFVRYRIILEKAIEDVGDPVLFAGANPVAFLVNPLDPFLRSSILVL